MKHYKILSLLASLTLLIMTAGCNDESALTPLESSSINIENTSFNSLTFKWNKVAGAVQYSYQLTKTGTGVVIASAVTNLTNATFTDLEASTDYTLTVLAYAKMGSDQTTSAPIVLEARTADIEPIPSPVPVFSREGNTAIFNWEAIESAQGYRWTLSDEEGTQLAGGDTRGLTASVSDMKTGKYTFAVIAKIEAPGVKDSNPGTITFEFDREREEIWRVSGKYTSVIIGSSWNAEMVAYDDNSYVIEGWYGVKGYDFDFALDVSQANNMFVVSDKKYTYDSTTGRYAVATGLSSPTTVKVATSNNASAFEGAAGKGQVTINVTDGTTRGDDTFIWGTTIDDLCGDWIIHTYAYSPDYGDTTDNTETTTITKVDDTTIQLQLHLTLSGSPWYFDVEAKVDIETMTFTIAPKENALNVFTFAGCDGEHTPVTGTISPVKFSITGWTLLYPGYTYNYIQDGLYEFTRP